MVRRSCGAAGRPQHRAELAPTMACGAEWPVMQSCLTHAAATAERDAALVLLGPAGRTAADHPGRE